MILNERQYQVSKAVETRLAKEVEALARVPPKGLTRRQRGLLLKAGKGQLEELRRELEEYEAIRDRAIPIPPISSIEEIPLALIRVRIARGWTQARLAEELGVSEQQVQRDEANAYRSASVERLRRIADALDCRLSGVLKPTLEDQEARRSRSMIREQRARSLGRRTR